MATMSQPWRAAQARARRRLPLVVLVALLGSVALSFVGVQKALTHDRTAMKGLKFDVEVATPKRGGRKEKLAQEERERREAEEEEAKRLKQLEEEIEAAEEKKINAPHLYQEVRAFQRLQRQDLVPGHLVLRRWLKKGKKQGFTTVPFSSALRPVVQDPNADICIVSRREQSDKRTKAWQERLEELPLFDISGVATPEDLDPLEPSWSVPLDELPSHEELQQQMQQPEVLQTMQINSLRTPEELKARAESNAGTAKLLREVVSQLPPRLLEKEYRELVRQTVLEAIMVMWAVQSSANSSKLKWRIACADDQEAPSKETSLRAIFLLAGEPLEFIPQQFVDRKKFSAEQLLSAEQMRRMDSQAWAASLTKMGTNVSQAYKQVPPGWMTVLKGDSWPGMQGKGAVYRLPQFGKRLYIEVDHVSGAPKGPGQPEAIEDAQDYQPSFLQTLGPLAGLAALVVATWPFKEGQAKRIELEQTLRALQRRPEVTLEEETARLNRFEQRLWTDLEPEEAPVVLVVGTETETGQVVLRKLITSGYPCVELKSASEGPLGRRLSEGTTFVTAVAQTRDFLGTRDNVSTDKAKKTALGTVPDSLYDAVAGVDKLVICDCDDPSDDQGEVVGNVLRAWQIYRQDFAESQRAYSSKVQVFNFQRSTDFELWDLERQYPSDMCYGVQRAGWTRNERGTALFIGQFFEPLGQCQLRSPKLKLNFSRFGGIILCAYNAAVKNKFSFFVRTSDFERSRVQFEFEFECEASSWNYVRMPFNAMKAVRTDGMPLPEGLEVEFRREDVVQMGICFRTEGEERVYKGDRLNYFSLAIDYIKAFRSQKEPQVVYVGSAERTERKAHATQAEGQRGPYNGLWTPPKTSAEAVLRSGLAFTMLRVNGLNDHPGGKFPVVLEQAPLERPHLSFSSESVGSISRGDVAALLVSAMSEPNCVNTEIIAGEPSGTESSVEITSTLQENVGGYLKQLTPNK